MLPEWTIRLSPSPSPIPSPSPSPIPIPIPSPIPRAWLGFGNLRARDETASPRAIGSPHRPTSHDVPPSPARKKWLVSLTERQGSLDKEEVM
jgi:hypothetical protein